MSHFDGQMCINNCQCVNDVAPGIQIQPLLFGGKAKPTEVKTIEKQKHDIARRVRSFQSVTQRQCNGNLKRGEREKERKKIIGFVFCV